MRWTWWNLWTLCTAFNRNYLQYLGTNKCDPFSWKMGKKGCAALSSSGWDFWGLPVCSRRKTPMILHQALNWPTANALNYFSIFLFILFIFPSSCFSPLFTFLFTSCISFSLLSIFISIQLSLPSSSLFLLPQISKPREGLLSLPRCSSEGICQIRRNLRYFFFAAQHY